MAQKLVSLPQPVGQRGEHFQCDIWIAPHKGKEMVAREHGEPRVLGHPGVRRAAVPVEQSHFTEEIAAVEFSQSHLASIHGVNANSNLSPFN